MSHYNRAVRGEFLVKDERGHSVASFRYITVAHRMEQKAKAERIARKVSGTVTETLEAA